MQGLRWKWEGGSNYCELGYFASGGGCGFLLLAGVWFAIIELTDFATFLASLAHESFQYYLSSFIDEDRLVPLSAVSTESSYSQEYLSLRARQGKFDAVKIDNIWYSSKRALKEYQNRVTT